MLLGNQSTMRSGGPTKWSSSYHPEVDYFPVNNSTNFPKTKVVFFY